MGALHEGHLALVATAKRSADVVVCSIFVNPTQFNDPADLAKYPRTPESDARKLEEAGCDVLFMPPYKEMYEPGEQWHLDLGALEQVLEGRFRPGHFQGVTQVVNKLFHIMEPDMAFFGQKDFQQFRVITKMAELLHLPVKLVMHPIVRERSGLAMSSRNTRLSEDGKQRALILSETLGLVAAGFGKKPLTELRAEAMEHLIQVGDVEPEYLEICNPETLESAKDGDKEAVVLVAARVEGVRLIDNRLLTFY
jgi:pantoate--beta-alanine ligase